MATTEEVKKLAALARLDLPESELAAFAAEFDSILKYVGQLDSLDIDVSKAPEAPKIRNAFRADEHAHLVNLAESKGIIFAWLKTSESIYYSRGVRVVGTYVADDFPDASILVIGN